MAFVGTSIRFELDVYTSTNKLKFTDITDYIAGGMATDDVLGILKVVAPSGDVLYKNTGYDSDDYSSPDIDLDAGTDSYDVIPMEETVSGDIANGTYTVYYKIKNDTSSNEFSTNKDFAYCFTAPEVVIDITHSCATSKLTSTDSTDYTVTCNNTATEPDTLTRVHSITPPSGSGFATPADTSDATRIMGANIWTNTWQTTIETTLTYVLATWDSADYLTVNHVAEGSDSHEVDCETCGCDIRACINSLYNEWIEAKTTNVTLYRKKGDDLAKLSYLWMQYQQAKQCGADYDTYCDDIKTILSANNCSCSDDDAASTEVIPYDSTTAGMDFLFGTTDPDDTDDGNDGDVYLNTTSNDLFKKVLGSWELQGNIKGDTGDTGATGATGAAGANGTTILENRYTAAANTIINNEEELIQLAIDTENFNTAGDILEINAVVSLTANTNDKQILLKAGDVTIMDEPITATTTSNNDMVFIKAIITQLTVGGNKKVFYQLTTDGRPSEVEIRSAITSIAIDLATTSTVTLACTALAVGDITGEQLFATLMKG